MNDTSLHDTSGGAGFSNTVRGRSGNAEGPSGSHYIIGPLQTASGPRKKKNRDVSFLGHAPYPCSEQPSLVPVAKNWNMICR